MRLPEKGFWPSGQTDSNLMANSNENQLLFYNLHNICNYHFRLPHFANSLTRCPEGGIMHRAVAVVCVCKQWRIRSFLLLLLFFLNPASPEISPVLKKPKNKHSRNKYHIFNCTNVRCVWCVQGVRGYMYTNEWMNEWEWLATHWPFTNTIKVFSLINF